MKKVINLDDWILTEGVSDEIRIVEFSLHLEYLDVKHLYQYKPSQRNSEINKDMQEKFKLLIETNLFDTYERIGKCLRPSGIKTKVPFNILSKIAKLKIVKSIFIKSISHARKKSIKKKNSFYCVKMTVAIQIEGYKKGMQTYEERMVLVKATSFEDAYKKVEKQKKDYEIPYLNYNGELVRWKIESYDDCYSTGKDFIEEFYEPNGVEVFSTLKKRRFNKSRFWDGSLDD